MRFVRYRPLQAFSMCAGFFPRWNAGRAHSIHRNNADGMITKSELKRMAKAKLKDAEILFRNRRYDNAIYLCGYAVELTLKARICATLKWRDFPEKAKDFHHLTSLKTHNLDILLRLSGIEEKIRADTAHFQTWSVVQTWNPESRYHRVGSTNRITADTMIESVKTILQVLR